MGHTSQPSDKFQVQPPYPSNLYFSKDDIAGGLELYVGMPVFFHLYEDENGLGADEITPGDAPLM